MAAADIKKNVFIEEVIEGKKTAVIDFWAPWCTYCRRIGPAYDKIADQYGESLIVGKVNVDEELSLAEQFHVEVIPTLIFFKDGKEEDRIIAPESKAQIEAFIKIGLE